MQDHVESSHMTKFDAFRVNSYKTQVTHLETWFKINTNIFMLRVSLKTIWTLKMFYQFCYSCKILSFTYHLKEAEMKITYVFWVSEIIRDFHLSFFQMVGEWEDFTVVTKLIDSFKNLYGFGGHWEVCMDFEPCFKVFNSVKWLILTWSFMWWCRFNKSKVV